MISWDGFHWISLCTSTLLASHRIDANVDDAEMNVEAAHHEILKYFKSVSSNRMLMIKVFGIMIVFFVIFVVFMAWRLLYYIQNYIIKIYLAIFIPLIYMLLFYLSEIYCDISFGEFL